MFTSLNDVNLNSLLQKNFTPSPSAWEDQVIYFLLLDRFSDNKESGFAVNGTTPLFTGADNGNAVTNSTDAEQWREAGVKFTGGNLKGLTNKIDYLRDMGVTTVWISPVFKQVSFDEHSYHGYGIQDYLSVDPHFGNNNDLKELVDTAHAAGIYIILDIVLNHSGNVFSYNPDRYITTRNGATFIEPRWDNNQYPVAGFNDATGQANIPFISGASGGPDDAISPIEFRHPDSFTRKGQITNWDYEPEFLEGDFFSLKDIHLGEGDVNSYVSSAAFRNLCAVYKFWIAFADIDGYRIDTVKHMGRGATRIFASVIHEFAQRIGKNNFYLIGEITGSRAEAIDILEITGLNAALGIADIQQKMENSVKGLEKPDSYFSLFRNSENEGKGSHTWFRNKIVTMIDDHDKVTEGEHKRRFCADDNGDKLILNALALNAVTLGIPCVYYGSEQLFDGQGSGESGDRYIREAMFGGKFGAFRSKGRHFFDKENRVYKEFAKILAIRKQKTPLRRGRQYLRQISGNGFAFGYPDFINSNEIRSVIAWSRILDELEIVAAINTDFVNELNVWVTVDNDLNKTGKQYECIYSVDSNQLTTVTTVEARNGKAIQIKVPPAGFVLYEMK